MTSFVKFTDSQVSSPIVLTDQSWYGSNAFSKPLTVTGLAVSSYPLGGATNAYVLNFTGSTNYYIPGSINPTANASLFVYNVPLVAGQSLTLTVASYQASTRYYINQLKIMGNDVSGTLLWGSGGSFAAPFYVGGTPALSGTTPCVVYQTFTIVPVDTSRYVISQVSACT